MAEHLPIDRQDEPTPGDRTGSLCCYYNYRRKDGKRGHVERHFVQYTPINDCQLCGMRGTPRRVSTRGDVYGWNCDYDDYLVPSLHVLCTGCWNKARAIDNARIVVRELEYLMRKLKRTRRDGNDGR